jgi:predicted enzyme related to lactoylglutathione lyase
MGFPLQVVVDAHDPKRLASFWAEVLGYVAEPLPGDPPEWFSLVDPSGTGPRFLLQQVLERKSVKNRVHLDVEVGSENMKTRAHELSKLGGTYVREHNEPVGHWIVMLDPEGNEFCLH